MWLLDVNLPIALADALNRLSIVAETTQSRGWRTFQNGELVAAASLAGFTAILTRDNEFGFSAEKTLKKYTKMSIVIITLPQRREIAYITEFLKKWKKSPIHTAPGKIQFWPD